MILARAALLPEREAIVAWRAFRSAFSLDRLPPSAFHLLPLVFWNLRETGVLGADEPFLRAAFRTSWAANQRILIRAAAELEVLEEAEMLPVVVRGASLALRRYPHPGTRPIGDVDVLVAGERLDEARQLLTGSGTSSVLDLHPRQTQNPSTYETFERGHFRGRGLPAADELPLATGLADRAVLLRALGRPLPGILAEPAALEGRGPRLVDLREVPVRYINLERAARNARELESQLGTLGFRDVVRFPAREIPPPAGTPGHLAHYVGCARSHIDLLEELEGRLPAVVLEDDAVASEDFTPLLTLPEGVDAIYLGVSIAGEVGISAVDVGGGLARISGVLANHAVLYLSERYRAAVVATARDCVDRRQVPFDVGCAEIQEDFVVLTPHRPFFFQADSRESRNRWEALTRAPLPIRAAAKS
ncbi:MAG: nucleotidyltransferase family protein [Thermoanaerobaculia bacterium]